MGKGFCQVLLFEDGWRCENCRQLIMPGQKECPSCHCIFTNAGNDRFQYNSTSSGYKGSNTDAYTEKNVAHTKVLTPGSTAGFGRLVVIFVLSFMLVMLGNILMEKYGIQLNRGGKANTTHIYLESPSKGTTQPGAGAFGFEVTQMFFKAEENISTENAILKFLTDESIPYTELRYTSEGYYSADLSGLTANNQEEYQEKVSEINKKWVKWSLLQGKSIGVSEVSVQGHYKSFK
ncbi:MAG: hypothetical protein J5824_05465 [Lachnospiraceae bacterium]|nr:hypothetical protein [Lachnospiraceae bacterium]